MKVLARFTQPYLTGGVCLVLFFCFSARIVRAQSLPLEAQTLPTQTNAAAPPGDTAPPPLVLPGRSVNSFSLTPLIHNGIRMGQPLVHITLADSRGDPVPATFVLDTGATITYVADATVRRLGLVPVPRLQGHTITLGGTRQGLVDLRVGLGRSAYEVPAGVLDAGRITASTGPGVDGILGMNLLCRFAALFDFHRQIAVTVDQGGVTDTELDALGLSGAVPVPIFLADDALTARTYRVWAQIVDKGHRRREAMLIDTGSSSTQLSNETAVALSLTGSNHTGEYFQSGAFRSTATQVDLRLGEVALFNMPVSFPADASTPVPPTLGVDALSVFPVVLDFPAGKMYLDVAKSSVPVVQIKPVAPAPAVAAPAAKP